MLHGQGVENRGTFLEVEKKKTLRGRREKKGVGINFQKSKTDRCFEAHLRVRGRLF